MSKSAWSVLLATAALCVAAEARADHGCAGDREMCEALSSVVCDSDECDEGEDCYDECVERRTDRCVAFYRVTPVMGDPLSRCIQFAMAEFGHASAQGYDWQKECRDYIGANPYQAGYPACYGQQYPVVPPQPVLVPPPVYRPVQPLPVPVRPCAVAPCRW
jgi:hypothetical protein